MRPGISGSVLGSFVLQGLIRACADVLKGSPRGASGVCTGCPLGASPRQRLGVWGVEAPT